MMELSPVVLGVLLVSLFGLSWFATGKYISYARKAQILDRPNERSSHKVPTPRGGGLVFVVLFLVIIAVFLFLFPQDRNLWIALLGGGSAVAMVGWIDDRRALSAKVRIVVHIGAVSFALICLGGMPSLSFGNWSLHLGFWGYPLALLGGVWSINLYNFMDGIDGIAASEAILVSLLAALLLLNGGSLPPLALALFALAVVVLGFLPWNWQPAKVFMGDVASGFLGYAFAVFIFASEGYGLLPFSTWLLLLSLFVADATFTVISRIARRQPLSQAHREHAYQAAVKKDFSHTRVTLAFIGLNAVVGAILFIVKDPFLLAIVTAVWFVALFALWRCLRRADRDLCPGGAQEIRV